MNEIKIGREKICGVEEACGILKISRPTLYKYCLAGIIPYKRLGKRWIFTVRELKEIDVEGIKYQKILDNSGGIS